MLSLNLFVVTCVTEDVRVVYVFLPDGKSCCADVYGLHNPTGLKLSDNLSTNQTDGH